MATCKDCAHYDVCSDVGIARCDIFDDEMQYTTCLSFKDKSRYIELPCKPIPLMKDKNPFNSDVYCPYCGTNLSGYYGNAPQSIIQCFNCGEFLIDALEKQIPKKPKNISTEYDGDYGYCPCCNNMITDFTDMKVCGECGQKLDWR